MAWWVASTIPIHWILSSYPGSVTFFLTFFFLFIISFFANELFMWPIYRPVACNELMLNDHSNPYVESTTVFSDTFSLPAMSCMSDCGRLGLHGYPATITTCSRIILFSISLPLHQLEAITYNNAFLSIVNCPRTVTWKRYS